MSDIMNIQGDEIPQLSNDILALLEQGKTEEVQILDGSSNRIFSGKKPYAITSVKIKFKDEENLRRCVRLLRWSDERLLSMGASILWAWNKTTRYKMEINFAVNWYDKAFFDRRKDAVSDKSHISYFKMFGSEISDMEIDTSVQ